MKTRTIKGVNPLGGNFINEADRQGEIIKCICCNQEIKPGEFFRIIADRTYICWKCEKEGYAVNTGTLYKVAN